MFERCMVSDCIFIAKNGINCYKKKSSVYEKIVFYNDNYYNICGRSTIEKCGIKSIFKWLDILCCRTRELLRFSDGPHHQVLLRAGIIQSLRKYFKAYPQWCAFFVWF